MGGILEFHGRLSRSDKRPANPGDYHLLFRLHGHARVGAKRDKVYWEEPLERVAISPGGFYRVVLGRSEPISSKFFEGAPRWMSVQVVRAGCLDLEHGVRIPVMGQQLRLDTKLARTQQGLQDLEQRVRQISESTPRVDKVVTRINRLGDAIAALTARAVQLEDDGRITAIVRRLEGMIERVDEIDKVDGRLDRAELELEELIGADGDVVDLNERMDRMEGQGPALIARLRQKEQDEPKQLEMAALSKVLGTAQFDLIALGEMIDVLRTRVEEVSNRGAPTAADVGGISRSGDVMSGGLSITRGGLEVLSGGISCRGATVTTLEASNVVKASKAIVDAIELRGDLTVDNAKRVVQVRSIEGRQASARRDGALHLNSRGGAEVVIGQVDAARGVAVHGSVRTTRIECDGGGAIAQVFETAGELQPGDVVRVNDEGTRVQRVRKAHDPRVIGVVTDDPGLLGGGGVRSGTVAVALYGVVSCRVLVDGAPIRAGDLLVASSVVGYAMRCEQDVPVAPGVVLGKALAPLLSGRGTVLVLLGRG